MAHTKLTLESVLKAKQAIRSATARFTKQEAEAMSTLNEQLRPLGFQIERVEAGASIETAPKIRTAPARHRRSRYRPRAHAVRCPVARCGRTFHYPMHLGRHLRTVHGQKG